MNRATRSRTFLRIVGLFSVIAGAVELFLVLTRAHFVFSMTPGLASGLANSPLAFVAQIGLLVILALIGIAFAGRGIQLCVGCSRQSIKS